MASKIVAGFIGLGNMGRPMATRIAKAGLPLRLWARRPDAIADLLQDGRTETCKTPRALAMLCDVVSICVRTDAEVLDVVLRERDGVLSGMTPGSVLLIHSTVHPDTISKLDREVGPRGVKLVDAPVSGGPTGAEAGLLTVFLGGEMEAIARAGPVLRSFGSNLCHLGRPGTAQLVKLINNSLCYANAVTALSSLELAQQLGVDIAQAAPIIAKSSGGSHAFELLMNPMALQKMVGPSSNVSKDAIHLAEVLASRGMDSSLLTELSLQASDRIRDYVASGARATP